MRDISCNHNFNDVEQIKNIASHMPHDEEMYDLSEFFKAFSDPSRLKIITALSLGELCVCDICDIVDMSQSAVSHQLRYLKNIGILKSVRNGRSIIYSLKDEHIMDIYTEGLIHIREKEEL